ncbi:peptide/nickel transport system substrate-binding protein [Candidatus Magnetomoraceae bacterium gMMP-15]
MSIEKKFKGENLKKLIIVISMLLVFSASASGSELAEIFPPKGWMPKPNPIASQDAVIGGELSVFAGQFSKSFNYYLDNNVLSAEIFGAMYETLLSMNPISLEYEPGLAEKWSISSDKKTFTFWINPKAGWSDGKAITAHDVKWTWDAVMNPKNLTGPHKVSLERFEEPVVIDRLCIKFTAKEVHWQNLGACGSFHILPKHAFENKDFNKINFEFPVVSGHYQIGKIKERMFMTLERRDDWWNRNDIRNKGIGNFQTMKFMFFAERENAFEAFKKGMLDLFPIYTSRIWINESTGKKFQKNWILKQKVYNHNPIGFQGFAMNMREAPFNDIKVRKAMSMLINRPKMNKTLMYDQYFLHRSYFEDLYDKNNPNPNQLIEFNKERARKLLKEAKWEVNPKTGFLEKNGRKFSFNFLTRSASSEKFLNIYAEDLKDMGIEMLIDKKDWAAWARDMDSFHFQMTWAAWSAGVFKNPEGMWSSNEADRKSGVNITGFKNSRADALIEKQKTIFDVKKRHAICREIDKIITDTCPYVLLWNINYTRLLYWNKFGTPPAVLSKYGDERSAYWYWWSDQDSEADLVDAIKQEKDLAPVEFSVFFGENN